MIEYIDLHQCIDNNISYYSDDPSKAQFIFVDNEFNIVINNNKKLSEEVINQMEDDVSNSTPAETPPPQLPESPRVTRTKTAREQHFNGQN